MAKRPSKKSAGKKRTGRPRAHHAAAQAAAPAPHTALLYKVVELSTVDEGSLERTVNQWVTRGWNLDGVQFAMRESSKRPSMAFVFFTREGPVAQEREGVDEEAARERLARLASIAPPEAPPAEPVPLHPYRELSAEELTNERTWATPVERESDPWRRLEQLASEDEENEP